MGMLVAIQMVGCGNSRKLGGRLKCLSPRDPGPSWNPTSPVKLPWPPTKHSANLQQRTVAGASDWRLLLRGGGLREVQRGWGKNEVSGCFTGLTLPTWRCRLHSGKAFPRQLDSGSLTRKCP